MYDALTYLGSVPWRINKRVLKVMQVVWDEHSSDPNFAMASLPNKDDIVVPIMPGELPFRCGVLAVPRRVTRACLCLFSVVMLWGQHSS